MKMQQVLSGYVPVVQFRSDSAQLIQDIFIAPKVQDFFRARNVSNYCEVSPSDCIGSQDFETITFQYFYDAILTNIVDEIDPFKIATYAITHDKSLAIKKCESTGIEFTTINLGAHPVFYYLFVDLQDIFDFVRSHNLPKPIA